MNSKLISTYYHKDDEKNVARVKVPVSGEGYYIELDVEGKTVISDVFMDLEDAECVAKDWALGVEQ